MRWAVISSLIAGCGRFGFEEPRRADASDDIMNDAMIDAVDLCAVADGTCLVACVATDPDCVTTCGDGQCVGNAGELCPTCAADCATLTPVCGNGACDLGESPDCYADCGPSPWPWTAVEQQLVVAINQARMTGAICPGETVPRTGPPYTVDASFQNGPREAAWEIAHHDYFMMNGAGCNGRTFGDRLIAYNFSAQSTQLSATSAQDAVDRWLTSSTLCPIVLSTTLTTIAPAYATDVKFAYVVGYR